MTYDIYPLLLQNGAEADRRELPTAPGCSNSPEGVGAIEWYADRRASRTKISVPGVLSNGEKEKRANFASGNVAMMFEGPWGIAIQKQLNPKLNYDRRAAWSKGKTSGTMVREARSTRLTSQAQDKEAAWTLHEAGCRGPRALSSGSKWHWRLPGPHRCLRSQDWFRGAEALPGLRHPDAAAH